MFLQDTQTSANANGVSYLNHIVLMILQKHFLQFNSFLHRQHQIGVPTRARLQG